MNSRKSKRGFAAMDKEKRREIASKGGKSSSSQRNKENPSATQRETESQ